MIEFTLVGWDWIVIALYLVFIMGIGQVFKNVNSDASDFFRGGGNMLWWIAGMSAIVASISAWSFTAAAAKVYQTGFLLPGIWWIAGGIAVPVLWFIAPRFRQMRVITSLEAVYKRFGLASEQMYVYLVMPMSLFWGGVGLNAVAVFFASALSIDTNTTIIGMTTIVTVMSLFGGQWAVAASDFVQGLLMFLTVLVVVYFSVNLPEIGGVSNLHNVLPDRHFDFTENARPVVLLLWVAVTLLTLTLISIDLNGEGFKYLVAKDGKQVRKMVIMMAVIIVIIPLKSIMQLPAICAAVVYPDMTAVFPDMKVPAEGAFLAMAFKTLPQGMMGLLICGIFAAAMSSMDTAVNRNAGYFVRNVYLKYVNKDSSGEQQLLVGRIFTVVFGLIIILIAIAFNKLREMNLFDIFQVLNGMILMPLMIPVVLGILYKKTPSWSAWSTVLVGLITGAIAKMLYSDELALKILSETAPLNAAEQADIQYIFITIIVFVVSVSWFFMTSIFYKKSSPEFIQQVDVFFEDMARPIDHDLEDVKHQDAMQYKMLGFMCLILGGFILLGMLIPNELSGRLCFLFVGGVIFSIGLVLYRKYLKSPKDEVS
jgi:solute:Na+ symporter, SSS family